MHYRISFGRWLREHRRALDLTQDELARRVGCAHITIRKLEADEMRPSKQLAQLLAEQLEIPDAERDEFVRFARTESPSAPLPPSTLRPAVAPWHAESSFVLGNLPVPLASFIGREREMAELKRLVRRARLVTLTGPGGVGKTRLALEVATDLSSTFADGVWWVDLAPLAEPALVGQTLAAVLGIQVQVARPLLATLTDALRKKKTLLILDNCEHLIAASTYLAETLLVGCPPLQILATSREVLNIAGENVFQVPSLSTPKPHPVPSVESLQQYDAVHLFAERAVATVTDFLLDNDNALEVAQICQQLDGIPLAIELAAAQLRMLSLEQIAARLDNRFRLLTGGYRTALPRHQTLQAMIDWSYNLLSESEGMLLQRVSVFAGGWTLEAAEAICAGRGIESTEVLGLLTQLFNKSLVIVERAENKAARYSMLETIRQYASGKLHQSKEAEQISARHLAHFLGLAQQVAPNNIAAEQVAWLNRFDPELANIRAALAWSLESGDLDGGLSLATALFYFWFARGFASEARAWMSKLLGQGRNERQTVSVAWGLVNAGFLAIVQSDLGQAQHLFEESLALSRMLNFRRGIADSQEGLGLLYSGQNQITSARTSFEASLKIFREIEDSTEIAIQLCNLGELERHAGNFARAEVLLQEALVISREQANNFWTAATLEGLGRLAAMQRDYETAGRLLLESVNLNRAADIKPNLATSLVALGEVAIQQGNYYNASELLKESIQLSKESRLDGRLVWGLNTFATLAAAQGQYERAARLFAAGQSLLEGTGYRRTKIQSREDEEKIASVRSQMDEATFARASTEGSAMTMDQAVAYALESDSNLSAKSGHPQISRVETC